NKLYFRDGSYWVMGATSGGTEQDAGTMYPTQIQDTNGNQIFIRYNTGLNSPFSNSSARINEIEDVRAAYCYCSPARYRTCSFTYNTGPTDPVPHATNITSYI